jgi:hypothetical protein
MARLSLEIRATFSQQQEQLLDIIDRAKSLLEAKMSSMNTSPEPDKIKQTLARADRNCQEMELAGIQLEEVIAKLDREILTQRKQRLGKVLEQGQN